LILVGLRDSGCGVRSFLIPDVRRPVVVAPTLRIPGPRIPDPGFRKSSRGNTARLLEERVATDQFINH